MFQGPAIIFLTKKKWTKIDFADNDGLWLCSPTIRPVFANRVTFASIEQSEYLFVMDESYMKNNRMILLVQHIWQVIAQVAWLRAVWFHHKVVD